MSKKPKHSPLSLSGLSPLEHKIIQELREWNKKGRPNGHCFVEGRSGKATKRLLAVMSLVSKKVFLLRGKRGNILGYTFSDSKKQTK